MRIFSVILLILYICFINAEIKSSHGSKNSALKSEDKVEGSGKSVYSNGPDKALNSDTEIESSAMSPDDEDGDVGEEGSGTPPIVSKPDKKEKTRKPKLNKEVTTMPTLPTQATPIVLNDSSIPEIVTATVVSDNIIVESITTTTSTPRPDFSVENKGIEIHPEHSDEIDSSEEDKDTIDIDNIHVEDGAPQIIVGTTTERVTSTTTTSTTTTTQRPSVPPVVAESTTKKPEKSDGSEASIFGFDENSYLSSWTTFYGPGIFAGIVGGVVIGLLITILLMMFIVYRMRKKDEGSYALETQEPPHYSYAYQKAPQKEFYA
uniref:Syndecan n=1 Tax=Rhabditophanes sp. KR3021 TaxID=114890 RepID=A0AC35UC79_9BILA